MNIIIDEWKKNSRESIRVTLKEDRGEPIIDLRTWFNKSGQMCPGNKGLTLSTKHLPALASALQLAHSAAQQSGLIVPDSSQNMIDRVKGKRRKKQHSGESDIDSMLADL